MQYNCKTYRLLGLSSRNAKAVKKAQGGQKHYLLFAIAHELSGEKPLRFLNFCFFCFKTKDKRALQ
jgi:hypothetical protein